MPEERDKILRISVGRQVVHVLEDLPKNKFPENAWHELIGQNVMDIVDGARRPAPVSEWREKQNTPIPIPYSLAHALWDFCCANAKTGYAHDLMKLINDVFPGTFVLDQDFPGKSRLGEYAAAAAPPPTVTSMIDWTVGSVEDAGTHEVRIVLTDKDEVRAWAMWMLDHG
jgi:hypothetical protein